MIEDEVLLREFSIAFSKSEKTLTEVILDTSLSFSNKHLDPSSVFKRYSSRLRDLINSKLGLLPQEDSVVEDSFTKDQILNLLNCK